MSTIFKDLFDAILLVFMFMIPIYSMSFDNNPYGIFLTILIILSWIFLVYFRDIIHEKKLKELKEEK